MCDVDRRVGGRAVPSSGDSVDRDGVVGTGLQTGDGGSGLSSWDRELLRRLTTLAEIQEGLGVKLRIRLRFKGNY